MGKQVKAGPADHGSNGKSRGEAKRLTNHEREGVEEAVGRQVWAWLTAGEQPKAEAKEAAGKQVKV